MDFHREGTENFPLRSEWIRSQGLLERESADMGLVLVDLVSWQVVYSKFLGGLGMRYPSL